MFTPLPIVLLSCASLAAQQNSPKAKTINPKPDSFQAAHDEYQRVQQQIRADVFDVKPRETMRRLFEQHTRDIIMLTSRFLAIVERDPNGPHALDAMRFAMLASADASVETDRKAISVRPSTIKRLGDFYATKPQIAEFLEALSNDYHKEASDVLARVAAKNSDPYVRALAYKVQIQFLDSLVQQNDHGKQQKSKARTFRRGDEDVDQFLNSRANAARGRSESYKKILLDQYRDVFPVMLVGHPAADITSKDLTGKPARLSDLKGKVIIIRFWDMKEKNPRFDRDRNQVYRDIASRLNDPRLAIVSICADTNLKDLQAFLEGDKSNLIEWWEEPKSRLIQALTGNSLHSTYLIDASGTLRYKNLYPAAIEKAARTLLREIQAQKTKPKTGAVPAHPYPTTLPH
jgi:peroxiredoxin